MLYQNAIGLSTFTRKQVPLCYIVLTHTQKHLPLQKLHNAAAAHPFNSKCIILISSYLVMQTHLILPFTTML